MRIIILFILICSLFSCNPSGHDPHTTAPSTENPNNDTLHIIKEFKGLAVYGNDEKKFISCDNLEIYHLLENYDSLNAIFNNLLPNAYEGESIVIQFEAEVKPSPDSKYSDLLAIKKIIKAEQKNFTNTCIPFDYWCKGNEPFWQIQISEKENLIDFYDPMQQKTTHFSYNKANVKDGITEYISKDNSLKNNIIVRIKNESCSDGMSEKKYNFSAEVVLNDERYNGCALKYGE